MTAATSVESHIHLFVFHLVLHLCISMMTAQEPGVGGKGGDDWVDWTRVPVQHNPQKKEVCFHYSSMWDSLRMPLTARLGPAADPLPLKPSSQTDGAGAFREEGGEKKKKRRKEKSARALRSRRAAHPPSGGWTKAATLNLNRLTQILTLENSLLIKSPAGKVTPGPASFSEPEQHRG